MVYSTVYRRSGRLDVHFECERLCFSKFDMAFWRQNPMEMAILRLLGVVFLRTYERQSCSEWLVALFSIVLVG